MSIKSSLSRSYPNLTLPKLRQNDKNVKKGDGISDGLVAADVSQLDACAIVTSS